ncbi:unnamed protein product [Adineta steineri]|uniref:Uncharacterized protein n=1 Tax=Adineta steineri TaxID=433720 RepID=A0A819SEG4_9BILA|nr:unnamed protein product [Adineta steineri]CAF0778959.1 unnamed protein product [Adineta steineri]CAF0865276.1 unnamed protein product [Adineta steineri]CAF0908061.1 unnamed protein product [Adineta steineri]CAF1117506.1 unnamed protein product [Adineta steineri]
MSYPTGMNRGTSNHFNKVASQMQAYLNNNSRRPAAQSYSRQQYAPARQQEIPGEAIASHLVQYSAHRMGLPPALANEFSGIAMGLLRNVLA